MNTAKLNMNKGVSQLYRIMYKDKGFIQMEINSVGLCLEINFPILYTNIQSNIRTLHRVKACILTYIKCEGYSREKALSIALDPCVTGSWPMILKMKDENVSGVQEEGWPRLYWTTFGQSDKWAVSLSIHKQFITVTFFMKNIPCVGSI